MPSFKKLIFAPFFLLSFTFLLFLLKENISSYELIFSLSLETFFKGLILSALICLTSFLYVLFASLASDFKIVLPIEILASILPLAIFDPSLGIVLGVGVAITLTIIYLGLESKLKSYLNFEVSSLFGPSMRHMASMLIIIFSITYFLSINRVIAEKGFEIPDSLIDSVLKLSPNLTEESDLSKVSLSEEQVAMLKQNPQALKQAGLDPKILDSIKPDKSKNLAQEVIKQSLQAQVQTMVKPYLSLVPAGLAVLFFILLQSLTSFINLLIYPLLWITFSILEKTGFIKFTEEQRTVRKMVV